MSEEREGCGDQTEGGIRTSGPEPLIFLCQAGSKAEQKWRFRYGSVAVNPKHQGLQKWWRRQRNLEKQGEKKSWEIAVEGFARGASFSSQKQELPIHLTYMKEQQLSPHTILNYLY